MCGKQQIIYLDIQRHLKPAKCKQSTYEQQIMLLFRYYVPQKHGVFTVLCAFVTKTLKTWIQNSSCQLLLYILSRMRSLSEHTGVWSSVLCFYTEFVFCNFNLFAIALLHYRYLLEGTRESSNRCEAWNSCIQTSADLLTTQQSFLVYFASVKFPQRAGEKSEMA